MLFGENYVVNGGNNGNKLKEIELFKKLKEIKGDIDKLVNNSGVGFFELISSSNGIIENLKVVEYNEKFEKFFIEVNEL